jgi:hypothetical protein
MIEVNARSYPHGNGRSFPFLQLTYQADRLEGGFSHWFWAHHHPSLVCSAITKPFSWGNTRRILSNLKHGQNSSSPYIGPRVCLRWRNCVTARRLTGSNTCPRPFCLVYIITLLRVFQYSHNWHNVSRNHEGSTTLVPKSAICHDPK